jgi:hypothetical protein
LPGVKAFQDNRIEGKPMDPKDHHGDGVSLRTNNGTGYYVERLKSGRIYISEQSRFPDGRMATNRSFQSTGPEGQDVSPEQAHAYGLAYADTVNAFATALAERIENPEGYRMSIEEAGEALVGIGALGGAVEVQSVPVDTATS